MKRYRKSSAELLRKYEDERRDPIDPVWIALIAIVTIFAIIITIGYYTVKSGI